MIRRVALLCALGLLALPSLAIAGQGTRACGDAGTASTSPRDVAVEGVDCATGRRLARRHANRTGRGEKCDLRKASCKLDGWTCRRRSSGSSGTKVSCRLSFGRVTWIFGA